MTPAEYREYGAGIVIEYGFHDTPFGVCLMLGAWNLVLCIPYGLACRGMIQQDSCRVIPILP